ncbi:MAG: UDP-N-acetylmuramyl-tripeptide synthetase [Patescibacteria group bacterium]|jgi:UDP-N-acetylmuramoyl-L-alanyl-D-glutamate--2,6-diaminopimelate ligase
MKELIKKIIPANWLSFYHKTMAVLAAFYYRHPSEKLIVIGVTGTKGKSTTTNIIWHMLHEAGHKAGLTATTNFRIHDKEWVNEKKMTMVGRFQLQKLLSDMVKAGCEYAVVETSSEGIKQWRHYGINYDIAIFLNLSPEHIESHGGYDNYKKAKGELFKSLALKEKIINGKKIKKTIIANFDDKESGYFLGFPADEKITYGTRNSADINATEIKNSEQGISFKINEATDFTLKQIGAFNIYNALPAIAVGTALGFTLSDMSNYLKKFKGMPGRMELINEGQNYKVIVDYAYEPKCLELVLQTIKELYINEELKNKIIAVSGPTGGGRDSWRRPVMGEILSKYCGAAVITTDDPYDDDPSKIADEMIKGIKNIKHYKIIDRREAIKKALSLAQKDDIVLLAGKGSDPVMAMPHGVKVKWDDRDVARELLHCG